MNQKLSFIFGRSKLLAQKHSPEILLGLGLIGMVGATVLAVKATLKVEEVKKQNEDALAIFEEAAEQANPKVYSEADYKQDQMVVSIQAKLRYVKLYAPATALGVAGMIAIVGSHGIMQRRSASLMAAYGLLQQGFNNYRSRVREELGEEKDRAFRLGLVEESFEKEVINEETGRKKKVKEVRNIAVPDGLSDYARFFDEYAPDYKNDPSLNLFWLKSQQNYANEKLRANGHLFLNEVYDMLGIPRTKAGAMVGWVLDGKNGGDNFVDFGLYETFNAPSVNGYDTIFIIDPNVDGVILDLI